MDRLTGKDAKLMMEALASVYIKEEVDQEVISEEVVELEENRGRRAAEIRAAREAKAAEQDRLYRAGGGDAKRRETRQMQGASSVRTRRPGMTRDQVIELGRKNLAAKDSSSSSSGSGMTPAQVKAAQDAANKARQQGKMSDLRGGGGNTGKSPISNVSNALDKPSVVSPKTGETTKFERRLPTMAELRAAQAARAKAKAGGATDREAGYQAAKAGVNAGKPAPKPAAGSPAAQAAAGAPNRKEDLFTGKPIPSSKPAPAAPAANTAKPAAAAPAPVVKKPTYNSGRQRARMEEVDIFNTIKEYLIGEGATEEEALKQMLTLTDEQRTEILEGSCGSKPKKKGGYKK